LYEDCIKDIDRAISQGYPEDKQYKLYLREARCLKYLSEDFETSLEKVNLVCALDFYLIIVLK